MKSIRQIIRITARSKRLCSPFRLQRLTKLSGIRYCCSITTSQNTFLSNFFHQIRERGDDEAIIFDKHHISYFELYQASLQCALYLREKYHIKQGDVISVIAQNIPQIQCVQIACHLLNCVYFPINGNLPVSTIKHYTTSVQSKLIITDNSKLVPFLDEFRTIYLDINHQTNENKLTWIGDSYLPQNTNVSLVESIISDIINDENTYNDDEDSLFLQTSGSTAVPKIVRLSNKSTNGWIDNGLNPVFKSTALLTSQSYHVSSYFQLMCSLCNGGKIIYPSEIMRDTMSNTKDKCLEMLRLTDLYKVNTVTLIVTPVYELVKLGESFGNSVSALLCGGDIIPVGLMQKFMQLHAGNDNTTIINAYGSTEAGIIGMSKGILCNQENANDLDLIQNNLMYLNKTPNIGHKIDEITGELYVKSNAIMKGYYNEPEKTKAAFTEDGYYKTGDTVKVLEDDGEALEFMVVSRNKQVIVSDNGRYIFPQYIEDELLSHKLVNGAVVVGVDSKLLFDDAGDGEYKYPVAFIRTCSKLNGKERDDLINELMILCRKRNQNEAPFKIFIVDDIPRSHIGKVDRNKLTDFANKYFEFVHRKQELYENEVFALVYLQETEPISYLK